MVSCEQIRKSVEEAMRRHDRGAVIIVEVPDAVFPDSKIGCIEMLIRSGADGVYLSLADPGDGLASMKPPGPGAGRVAVISPSPREVKSPGWIRISATAGVDELVAALQESLLSLKNPKKIIITDSFETLLENNTLAEALRLSEFLGRLVKRREVSGVIIAIRSSFPRKEFLRQVAIQADEVLRVDDGS